MRQQATNQANAGAGAQSPAPAPMKQRPPLSPEARRRKIWTIANQLLLIAIAVILVALAARNIALNLQARGLTSGFDFLWREAGFKVGFSLIAVNESSTYGRIFFVGLLNSLLISALGIIAATTLGFVVGIAQLSPGRLIRLVARLYVDLVRNLPLLLHVLLWQTVFLNVLPRVQQAIDFGGIAFLSNRGLNLPAVVSVPPLATTLLVAAGLTTILAIGAARKARRDAVDRHLFVPLLHWAVVAGLLIVALVIIEWQYPVQKGFNFRGGVEVVPELLMLLAALTVYNSSYIAEIVRAGIQSVNEGQRQAALSLGLPDRQTTKLVIVPQAIRVMIPSLANQYSHLIKGSALATVIGYPDLVSVFMGTSLNQTGRAIEIVTMTAAVYLTLTALVSLATSISRRIALVER